MKSRFLKWTMAWAVAAFFYWWLICKTQGQQLAAAAIAGLVVTAALTSLSHHAKIPFRIHWRWIVLVLRRVPLRVLREIGVVASVLAHSFTTGMRPEGSYQVAQVKPGTAREAAGRAVIFFAVSFPPNSYAVFMDRKDSLTFHQLSPQGSSPVEEWQT